MPRHGSGDLGGENLKKLTGGSAYGTPENTSRPFFAVLLERESYRRVTRVEFLPRGVIDNFPPPPSFFPGKTFEKLERVGEQKFVTNLSKKVQKGLEWKYSNFGESSRKKILKIRNFLKEIASLYLTNLLENKL